MERYDLVLEFEDEKLLKVARGILGRWWKKGIKLTWEPEYVKKLKTGLIVHYAGENRFYKNPREAAIGILGSWFNTANGLEAMVILAIINAMGDGRVKPVLVKQGEDV